MHENILLIRFKSIGDVILTLPAVHVARENFPSARIAFLTSIENAPLLSGFLDVDEVIALDRTALRSGNPLKMTTEFFRLIKRLRSGKFSLVIDLQGYGETAWLARITGARQRWVQLERPAHGWAYTRRIQPIPGIHPADAHLAFLKRCGLNVGAVRNEFILPQGAVEDARRWLSGHQLDPVKPILYLQPLTSGAHKNWPLENYLAVARHWRSRNVQVIFGGGPADRAGLEPARQEGFVVSAGTAMLVTAGIMQMAALVLGGDTGALHLAVAQGRRVVMLMHEAASGSPVPFQHRDWVVAAPMAVAIAKIPVAEVVAATERAISESAGRIAP